MSITIKGASSGGVDIVAPASGSDVTLTLPSTTGTVLLTNGDGSSLTNLPAGGVDGIVSTANATAITIDSSENVYTKKLLPQITADGTAIQAEQTSSGDKYTVDFLTDKVVLAQKTGGTWYNTIYLNKGNMGLGVTPDSTSTAYTSLHVGANAVIHGVTGPSVGNNLWIAQNQYLDSSSNPKYQVTDEASQYYQGQGKHKFQVAPSGSADAAISWNTAMVIGNQGNVGIINGAGTGIAFVEEGIGGSAGALQLSYDGSQPILWLKHSSGSGTETAIRFNRSSSATIGNINTTPSSTSYNTSSDYRLKENLVPITDSIERVKALKPYRFNFIVDPDVTVDGFVAHEVAESSCPEAISGEKDAMQMEEYEITPAVKEVRDDDGNIITEAVDAVMGEREVIDPQGIDQAKLVPLLTAALQDAIKRIEILENA